MRLERGEVTNPNDSADAGERKNMWKLIAIVIMFVVPMRVARNFDEQCRCADNRGVLTPMKSPYNPQTSLTAVEKPVDSGSMEAAVAKSGSVDAVDAGDQPVKPDDTGETPDAQNQRYAKQAWLCDKQLEGELFRKNTSSNFEPKGLGAFCLLRTLQGALNETDEMINELKQKCVDAGGKFVGQMYKLEVVCDLSGVK